MFLEKFSGLEARSGKQLSVDYNFCNAVSDQSCATTLLRYATTQLNDARQGCDLPAFPENYSITNNSMDIVVRYIKGTISDSFVLRKVFKPSRIREKFLSIICTIFLEKKSHEFDRKIGFSSDFLPWAMSLEFIFAGEN